MSGSPSGALIELMLLRKLHTAWLMLRAQRARLTASRSSRQTLHRKRASNVLVVCHGNIYRSPFVAALLRKRCGEDVRIRSSGFHPKPQRPSPPAHVASCSRYDVDLGLHRSSVIARADVEWADLIVLMDRRNWVSLKRLGASDDKLVWLGAFADGDVEIKDPYGRSERDAEAIVQRLASATERLAAELDQSASRGRAGVPD